MTVSSYSESADYGPPSEGRKYLRRRTSSGIWYYRRKRDGRWTGSFSFETTDEAEACVLYDKYDPTEALPTASQSDTCRKAFKHYIETQPMAAKTRLKYKTAWLYAEPLIGTIPVAKVTPRDIIAVVIRMQELGSIRFPGRPLSPNTIRANTMALSDFFASCTEEPTHYRDDNPVHRIGSYRPEAPEPTAVEEVVVVSREDIETLALELGRAQRDSRPARIASIQRAFLVRLSPEIGTRIAETLALKIDDWKSAEPFGELAVVRQVSVEGKAAQPETWFGPLKGRKGTVGDHVRMIPGSKKAAALIDAYVELGLIEGWLGPIENPEGLLFPSSKGTFRSPEDVGQQIAEASERVLDRRVTTHYFRHTFASRLLDRGATIPEIAEWLGNDAEVCRKRYAHRLDRKQHNTRFVDLMAEE